MKTKIMSKSPEQLLYSALFCLSFLFFFQGCSGFSHLTAVDAEQHIGPTSADCGKCHGKQYREWQGSAHNLAWTDPLYLEATDEYDDDSCFSCHIPGSIFDKQLRARSYNRDEGVSCVSCHLNNGAMYGPHDASGLVTPHPVQPDTNFFKSSALCGICHQATYSSWQENVAGQQNTQVRQCQQCHMSLVKRTATQGTNIFSRLLVSFEKQHQVRSHTIVLSHMADFPGAVKITMQQTAPFRLSITNQLPHDLPGGEFMASAIELFIFPVKKNPATGASKAILVCDTDSPLVPGQTRQLTLQTDSFGHTLAPDTTYTVQLILRQAKKNQQLQLAQTTLTTNSK